jgi:hypothetical protein
MAAGDAFFFDPARGGRAKIDFRCAWQRNTIAAKGAVLRLGDLAQPSPPVEAIFVQARANVFTDPYAGSDPESGLLDCEKEALTHGLLCWAGQDNVYDGRFRYFIHRHGTPVPERTQPYSVWAGLWGAWRDRNATVEPSLDRLVRLDRPPAAQLSYMGLPRHFESKIQPPPGADFARLGIGR